ncbi:MAG: LicD family protein [Clostridia bacterium]|jgi:lipopolysaccharide cholinephosphotransferase|nr:LicD family protein [Clostridia bacterium]
MKAEEFLKKAKESSKCPGDFDDQYRCFCRYQGIVLEVLKEFHRVCEKNQINYHVTYGSLLGLIRDDGLIPWDYDIDTFVSVSQKKELITALQQDLSEEYYVMCPETDASCRHYIARICPKGYNSAAVHLDVFFYCGAPDDARERKRFNRSLRRCARIRFSKKVNIKEESVGKFGRMLKLFAAKVVYSVFNEKKTDERYNRLIYLYPIEQSKYAVSADFFAVVDLFPIKMVTETFLYHSEIGEYRIPIDYEGFLKMEFGNYTEYPPLKTCIRQVTDAVRRFRFFEKIANRDNG